MDVELQILKHLKRSPRPTVAIIDQYCESYNDLSTPKAQAENLIPHFNLHQQWSNQPGWKTTLNNLRLIIQPAILFWMIIPWLDIFPNRSLLLGFHQLISIMNQFYFHFPDG